MEIVVDGKIYIPKEQSINQGFFIVRTYSAGVFAGYLKTRNGKECVLVDAIRLWMWKGAASLSQLAMEGVSCPNECKFAMPVTEIILTESIEIIQCTEKATKNIQQVPPWKV